MESNDRGRFYDDYIAFKSWDATRSASLTEIFDIEIRRTGIVAPASVLDWARERGYKATGVEIIEPLVEAARQRGHHVFKGLVHEVLDPASERFDLIVAFDVFEHLTIDQLANFLSFAASVLTPQGRLLARFPNGGSPFGTFYQSGDVTHLTAWSASSIAQVARSAGFELLGAFNAARPLSGSRYPAFFNKLRYLVRDLIEQFVGRLYLNKVMPLDPNLTVVLAPRRS
jgi:SAM-dependent methyltransferase